MTSATHGGDTFMMSGQDNREGDPPNKIPIALTATVNGSKVNISGPSGPFIAGKDTGAWQFDFTLYDNTGGLDVQFDSLDCADNLATCPPTGSGDNSSQIGGVTKNNSATPKTAGFTDNNSNKAKDGPMNVSFQWNFTCNDPSKTVGAYDPLISNGGRT
jgi:hypothetical protein